MRAKTPQRVALYARVPVALDDAQGEGGAERECLQLHGDSSLCEYVRQLRYFGVDRKSVV